MSHREHQYRPTHGMVRIFCQSYMKGISLHVLFSVNIFWLKIPRILSTYWILHDNLHFLCQIKAFTCKHFFSQELMSVRPIYEDSMKSAGLAHLDLNLLPSVLPGKGQASFVCCLTSRSRIFRSIILRRHHWRRRAAFTATLSMLAIPVLPVRWKAPFYLAHWPFVQGRIFIVPQLMWNWVCFAV